VTSYLLPLYSRAMPHPVSILPEPYRPPTREEFERAREMYAQGFTVSRILARTQVAEILDFRRINCS